MIKAEASPSRTDLAKAIENLKHQEDLKKDFDAKDSALEIVFLSVPSGRADLVIG